MLPPFPAGRRRLGTLVLLAGLALIGLFPVSGSWLLAREGSSSLEIIENPPSLVAHYGGVKAPFGRVFHLGWESHAALERRDDLSHPELVVNLVADRLAMVERRLDRRLEREITVILVPGHAELARIATSITGRNYPEHILGLAMPARGWILVRRDGLPASPSARSPSEVTLIHELGHLVVNRQIGDGVRVPRWLDEGICMYLAGGGISREDESVLSVLARLDALFPLAQIESQFPELHHPGTLAYRQSLMLVAYLVEAHGEEVLGRLLARLDTGQPLSRAYPEVTGQPWLELEPSFREWLRDRRSLLEGLVSMANPWVLITGLALVAMLVSWWRSRRLSRRLELEDELEQAARDEAAASEIGGEPLGGGGVRPVAGD